MDQISFFIALGITLFWPVIPIFWIPVHLFPAFFRRITLATYLWPLLAWTPIVYLILKHKEALFSLKYAPSPLSSIVGWIMFTAGTLLHLWTIKTLGLRIIGLPEVTKLMSSRLITAPPFSYSRHPTYLAHSLMFFGAAIATGYLVLWIISFVDLLVVQLVIIPWEEKELEERLGEKFRSYKKETSRFLPQITKK